MKRTGIFLTLTLLLFQIGWSQPRYDQRPHGQGGAASFTDSPLMEECSDTPVFEMIVDILTPDMIGITLIDTSFFSIMRHNQGKQSKQIQPLLFYSIAIMRDGFVVFYNRMFTVPDSRGWSVLIPALKKDDVVLVSINDPVIIHGQATMK